jgi:hypothetical protein
MAIADISFVAQVPVWSREVSLVAPAQSLPDEIAGFVDLLKFISIPTICPCGMCAKAAFAGSGAGSDIPDGEPVRELTLNNSDQLTESASALAAEPNGLTVPILFAQGITALHNESLMEVRGSAELSSANRQVSSVIDGFDSVETAAAFVADSVCSRKGQAPFRGDPQLLHINCGYFISAPNELKTSILPNASILHPATANGLASDTESVDVDLRLSTPIVPISITRESGRSIPSDATLADALAKTPQSLSSIQLLPVSPSGVSSNDPAIQTVADTFLSGHKGESGSFSPVQFSEQALVGSFPATEEIQAIPNKSNDISYHLDHQSQEPRDLVEFKAVGQAGKSVTDLTPTPMLQFGSEHHRVNGLAFVTAHEFRPVVDAILNEVKGRIHIGEQEATLQIDAPELGRVDIEIKLHGEQLSAQIVTESIESQFVIERHLKYLREALSESGLQLVNVRVDSADSQGWRSADRDASRDEFAGNRSSNSGAHSLRLHDDEPRRINLWTAIGSLSMWA